MRYFRMQSLLFLAVIVTTAIVGCGGGGGGGSSISPIPINTAPTLTVTSPSPNPATLDVSQSGTMKICFKAEDADGGKLSYVCTWTAGSVTPSAGTVDAGSACDVSFSAPNYDGLCTITVTVTDGQATAQKSVQINVVGAGSQPENELLIAGITSTPESIAPEGSAVLTADVHNPGGQTLTYKWASLYGHFAPNGATASWTGPPTPGVYGVFLTVSDGTDSAAYGVAVTVSGPVGGVTAQYFRTTREKNVVRLASEILRRTDPDINFNWWETSPDPAKLGTDGWGARWTGYVKAEQGGSYLFRVHADDGARMRIMNDSGDWVEVVPNNDENWTDHVEGAWLPSTPVAVQLQGGKWYPFSLDYFEGGGNAFCRLYWSVNGGAEEIVPQVVLKAQ